MLRFFKSILFGYLIGVASLYGGQNELQQAMVDPEQWNIVGGPLISANQAEIFVTQLKNARRGVLENHPNPNHLSFCRFRVQIDPDSEAALDLGVKVALAFNSPPDVRPFGLKVTFMRNINQPDGPGVETQTHKTF